MIQPLFIGSGHESLFETARNQEFGTMAARAPVFLRSIPWFAVLDFELSEIGIRVAQEARGLMLPGGGC
jgi:hypothetical protein